MIATCFFVVANLYALYQEFYWFMLLPALMAIVIAAFVSLDKVLMLAVFCTPFSVDLETAEILGNLGLFLPTEPIFIGIMLLFFMRQLYRWDYDPKILKHPVTLAIFAYLIWMFFTTITSEMFTVSIKHFTVRLWYITALYFFGVQVFRYRKNIRPFIWLYIISFTGIILYTLIHHSMYDFAHKPGHWVMSPFFNDHTSYGASLAFYFPFLLVFLFDKKYNPTVRFIISLLATLFVVAIIFSYTRAAWLSIAAAFGVLFILFFKIKFSTILITLATVVLIFFSVKDQVIMELERNKQDSSDDLTEHVQSMSNITSDASNKERLNRWNSALRMFEERPIVGWGPGTYQFQYAPFQHHSDKTIITTNFGDGGNAHSEYLGPLAESGVLGTLTYLLIVLVVFYKGVSLYKRLEDKEMKLLLVGCLLGLVTYYVHGGLNNFLDTDKAAVPFWGFTAIIVAIDLYHSKSSLPKSE